MFDLIIRNGHVIDGTAAPAMNADVGVVGNKIRAIGNLAHAEAAQIIDASGRFVTPGFIDIHTHTDETIFINPLVESKIHQGVTTEVGGNCGGSAAPLCGAALEEMQRKVKEYDTIDVNWRSMGEYLDRVEQLKISTNYVTFVGHGRLRASVMGYGMRAPTPDELAEMQKLLARSLEEGAWGMSTGLIYPPSSYADIEEIAALGQTVAEKDGVYASHIRNEGSKLLPAVEEALAVGRRAGVRVQLSHHKAAGKQNWGKVHQSIAMIEQARVEGVIVGADQYPYVASATGLSTAIPGWAHEGGVAQMVARLRDPGTRRRITDAVKARQLDKQDSTVDASWQSILVVGCKSDRSLQGKTVQEIADLWGKDPLETACDLLVVNDGTVNIVKFMMSEEDVQTVMRMPWVFVGSDAGARAPTGPLATVKYHPRSYGTFPRSLGRYVRELKVLEWEEAIAKMTSRPAQMLGLNQRGALRKGYFADIVVFDPATVTDKATYAEPIQFPDGIDYVIVNGMITVEHGRHTGARAGHVLRKA
jgi:N-acyl-D-amino-acid deacylase